ncbi:MAG: hypothetical protein QGG68_06495 [SAR324 cluster bacterium]|jgi:hypothetical protein|nr:hypothetical protein [SAR324 cluster bacterium]|tara:strand:- start:661 stop:1062 length:402 start_codon:yes stop_codon:yes gene_type:complete
MNAVVNEDNTQGEYKEERQMSKAASLAMELSKEKKRMQEEFDELQAQFEEVSPSTPSGGPDSYLKWIGVVSAVLGIFLQNAGLSIFGQLFYIVGAISWTAVGFYWNDKAVMLGSVIPATATAMNLMQNAFIKF